jgi:hypothetical protein
MLGTRAIAATGTPAVPNARDSHGPPGLLPSRPVGVVRGSVRAVHLNVLDGLHDANGKSETDLERWSWRDWWANRDEPAKVWHWRYVFL